MLRLILLRHATAEAPRAGQADHDRALTPAGRAEAAWAGRSLGEAGIRPDLVVCSTARRTRETLDGVLAELKTQPEIRYLDALFSSPDYLSIVQAEAGAATTILAVGHNPFAQDTAVSLARQSSGERGSGPAAHFPPGAYVVLSSSRGWADAGPRKMILDDFVRP